MKKHRVVLHGEEIAFYKEGQGPVLLLIHGMAGSANTWDAVIPKLAERYTVVAPDLLGHGDSERAQADYSLGGFATSLRDLLLRLGLDRATIVGQSLGGGVAMQFAHQYPQQCERLVLVSSGGFGGEVNEIMRALSIPGGGLLLKIGCRPEIVRLGSFLLPWLKRLGVRVNPQLREIGRSYASLTDDPSRRAFLYTLRSCVDAHGQRINAFGRLYLTVDIPCLIIWGNADPIIPVEHAFAAHEHIQGSRLEILPGVGHYPHCEAPERFIAILEEFLLSTVPASVTPGKHRQLMLAVGYALPRGYAIFGSRITFLAVPAVYTILSALIFALIWPVLFVHRKLRSGIPGRLGFYPPDFLADRRGPRIWMHGASAGDLLSLLPIYQELKRLRPDAVFIISMMTNSGETIARKRFADADAVTFLPYDVPGIVGRTVRVLKPDVLVLEYTELWPNLIRAVNRRGGRIVITNGRLAESNVPSYRLLFLLTGNLLKRLSLLLMREEAERERALSLGAPPDRVQTTGNTKFDALLLSLSTAGSDDALPKAFALQKDDWLWVAGSTHEGEEGLLLDVFARLRADFPQLRLVIAPRYLERVQRIVAIAEDHGLEATLRSSSQPKRAPVIILDTIGELIATYRLARIVFVGGSFTRRGGQNILEPAACGKAVLFGPHMENFHDSVQVLVGRGGIQVKDARHLQTVAHDLLAQPEKLSELGELARAAVSSVSGASVRDAALIAGLLPPRPFPSKVAA